MKRYFLNRRYRAQRSGDFNVYVLQATPSGRSYYISFTDPDQALAASVPAQSPMSSGWTQATTSSLASLENTDYWVEVTAPMVASVFRFAQQYSQGDLLALPQIQQALRESNPAALVIKVTSSDTKHKIGVPKNKLP